MRETMSTAVVPIVAVVAVLLAAGWVYTDAARCDHEGHPVRWDSELGSLDTPTSWAIACVIACVIVLPLYLTVRRN